MTKLLKRRFIIFTMMAVTGLLVFIVLAMDGLNWVMLERQSDSVLEMIVRSDGAFHKMDFDRPPPFVLPLDMDRMRSSRFFIVKSDADGNIIDVNTDQISSIDNETAKAYAVAVWESGKKSGHVDRYKFAVKQIGSDRLTFFMDISEQRANFYMVIWLVVYGKDPQVGQFLYGHSFSLCSELFLCNSFRGYFVPPSKKD